MNTVLGIIIGLLVLMTLVVLHEFGHFLAARISGVKVNEFGIGFPPRIIAWVKDPKTKKWSRLPKSEWEKKPKTTILSLNWLPIGGFCAMDGESDDDTRKGTFGAASFWAKTKILFAGVAMNWLTAFVILTVLAVTGMPKFIDNQAFTKDAAARIIFDQADDTTGCVEEVTKTDSTSLHSCSADGFVEVTNVEADSPAEEAGFLAGDVILAASTKYLDYSEQTKDNPLFSAYTLIIGDEDNIYGIGVVTPQDLIDYNNQHLGEQVLYEVIRDGKVEFLFADLNPEGSDYALGVTLSQKNQPLYQFAWYQAPLVGAATTIQLTGETYKGLGQMLVSLGSGVVKQFSGDDATREEGKTELKSAGDSVSGPVGIIGVIFPAFTEAGPTNLAFLAALISVSLACMNVLPIPALDGGRWLMIAISRLFGKKLKKETEEKIVSRAFIFLILLIILITVLDVTRLF